jgi:hypothetical protein
MRAHHDRHPKVSRTLRFARAKLRDLQGSLSDPGRC